VHEHAPRLPRRAELELDMNRPDFSVALISNGLEFGHGPISGEDDPDVLQTVDEAIRHNPRIIVPLGRDNQGETVDDDGCGDGRRARLIFRLHETYKRNLHRAKVFGGAVAMTAAAIIGVGEAQGKTLNEVFDAAVDTLIEKKINFGAHTSQDAASDKTGCGAIDQAPEAILAVVKYEEPIRRVISALGVEDGDLDKVYTNFRGYVADLASSPAYNPKSVLERIIQAAKVIKELDGDHRERRIIFNNVRGYTVNQKLIRQVSRGRAQVFAVDLWRLEDIAEGAFKGQPKQQQAALLGELVYTLAISAVLTKGDLPVYSIDRLPPQ
jgi:hypothetical protein